tara:strand:- start:128 stop:826 length:699 start_codon:yes stop_codon:yes gene_type:complete
MTIIEWCRENDIWYLQLPLEIPKECIAEAQAVFDEGFFVDHRYSDGDGWCSAAIHSFVHEDAPNTRLGWHHTKNPAGHGLTEDNVKWGWTEIADIAPETKRWLEAFPNKGYRRCRFMLLRPEGRIEAHNDSNPPRDARGARRNISSAINLAFYQPDNCYLRRCDTKEELPFKNCTGFWFDNGVEHEAYNASNENRFHFIVHGGSNNARKKLMLDAVVAQFGKDVLKEIDERF